ncbi:MAG TPA: P22 phage major capsid protein family protein, partial [Candidatus Paceibacterota bacterium]
MSNSILTIDMITRKALEILENNLVLTRNVNRQYDDSFAVEGAKIGSTLRIRKPDRALVTDGAALQVQDDNEQYTTLTVSSQKHIGVNFTSAELTMQLDDFAERVLKPRISQLASSVDNDVASVYKNLYQSVGTPGTTPGTSLVLLQGHQKLNEMAAMQANRYATVN